MRKFEADHAIGLEQDGKSGDKIVDVGNMREHVVADDEIGGVPLRIEVTGPIKAR